MRRQSSAPHMYIRRDSLGLENFDTQLSSCYTDDSEVKYSSLVKELGAQPGALHQPLGLKTQSMCVREARKASQRKQRRRRSNALDLNFFQRCDTSGQNCMGASKTMCKSRSGVFVKSNSLGSLGLESEGVLQQPLGLKTHDGKYAEDKRVEQQLEEIWKQTVIQNTAAALRNAISVARDAGHKVRFNSMTLLNYGEDSSTLDSSSVTNHGLAESCGLRAAIKRTLRKGLGEEYKDLLASAVRVLEKLEIQRALLQALSQRGVWGHPGLQEVVDRSNKAGIQSPEFELAKALIERDRASASPSTSPTVSPCHIRAEEVACNFNLHDGEAPEASQGVFTVTEPSGVPEMSTPSHSTLANQRKFQKVVIKDAAEVDHAETEGSTVADSPTSAKLPSRQERQGSAGMLKRRAPPLASLVSQPWAGLGVGPLMEDGLHPRRAEN